jgi:hypothetical protein
MSARDEHELDAMLAGLAERAQVARDFQCQTGQDRHVTRKLPRRAIAAITDWCKGIAAQHATMDNSVVATATAAQRVGSADTSGSPSADKQGAAMSVSPTLALRLDPETIERLDAEAELRGHTRSSLARHLLKVQLDGQEPEHDQPTEVQR